MYLVLFVIAWFILGFIGAGIEFAWYQATYPSIANEQYIDQKWDSYVFALMGPANLLLCLYLYGTKHGFKLL